MKVTIALAALLVLSCAPPPVDEVGLAPDGGVIVKVGPGVEAIQRAVTACTDCPPGYGSFDVDAVAQYTLYDQSVVYGDQTNPGNYDLGRMFCKDLKMEIDQLAWDIQVVNGRVTWVLASSTVREVILHPQQTIGPFSLGYLEGTLRVGLKQCQYHARQFLPPGQYYIWVSMACPNQAVGVGYGYADPALINYQPSNPWMQAGQSTYLVASFQGPWQQKGLYRQSMQTCGLSTGYLDTSGIAGRYVCAVPAYPLSSCPPEKRQWFYW